MAYFKRAFNKMKVPIGTLEDCSAEQLNAAKALKDFVIHELKYTGHEINLWFLLRFGRARNFDLSAMKKMLELYVQHRRDGFFVEHVKSADYHSLGSPVQNMMESGFFYTDRTGRPVYVLVVKNTNWEKLLSTFTVDQLIAWHLHKLELYLNIVNPIASKAANKRIENVMAIIDFKDTNPLMFTKGKLKDFIQKLAYYAQNFFPEILGKLYMINVPTLFYVLWQIVKLWLDDQTKKKIEIDSGAAAEKIQKDIDPEHLHVRFGGKRDEDVKSNPGPWISELNEAYQNNVLSLPSTTALFEQYYLTQSEKIARKAAKEFSEKAKTKSLFDLDEEGIVLSVPSLRLSVKFHSVTSTSNVG